MAATGVSLVIQTSFLGDTVLTTPLIAELAERGPVDVVVTPAAASLLQHDPRVRTLFTFDKRGADSGVRGLLGLARRLRAHRRALGEAPPVAYLVQGSVRSGILALLSGAPRRIGFATSAGRALYTHRVPYRSDLHHAERLWRLAQASVGEGNAAASHDMPAPRLFPGETERAAVDALLRDRAYDRPLVALAPGSVWGTKRWPYYGELAERLAPRVRLAIVGGPDDGSAARAILDRTNGAGIVDATGRLSLLASAELIARAALLVTNDSSPQHLASAMGTPTITLFGPTVPAFGFGPLAPRSLTLGHESLDCRPCHHHGPSVCPLGHWRCMRELDVDRVERAALALLAHTA